MLKKIDRVAVDFDKDWPTFYHYSVPGGQNSGTGMKNP